jgi:DNA-binding transcriptional LysR family regulator
LSLLRELQSGQLVRVLPDWQMGTADINVVLPAGRAAKPSARAFAEFVSSELREQETIFGRMGLSCAPSGPPDAAA